MNKRILAECFEVLEKRFMRDFMPMPNDKEAKTEYWGHHKMLDIFAEINAVYKADKRPRLGTYADRALTILSESSESYAKEIKRLKAERDQLAIQGGKLFDALKAMMTGSDLLTVRRQAYEALDLAAKDDLSSEPSSAERVSKELAKKFRERGQYG